MTRQLGDLHTGPSLRMSQLSFPGQVFSVISPPGLSRKPTHRVSAVGPEAAVVRKSLKVFSSLGLCTNMEKTHLGRHGICLEEGMAQGPGRHLL